MNVLFVCTGNTCRSPMAEAIFACRQTGSKHNVFSRGTSVFFEETINPKAKITLEKMGISGFEHTSQQISEEDICSADLVLTMTSSHKMLLKSAFPKHNHKIFTLSEKAFGKDKAISDPYGQNEDVYLICAKEIEEAVVKLLEKI